MTLHTYLSHAVAKPIFAGITAGIADRLIMKNENLKSNLYFAGAVGGGIFAVSWVEPLVSKAIPVHSPIGHMAKSMEGRILEVACGSASAYALNRFVLKNEYTSNDLMYKLAIIAGSDFVGESVCEFLVLI